MREFAEAKIIIDNKYYVALTLIASALVMSWPAFFNGFPLMFPDSISYIDDGARVARALFLHGILYNYTHRSHIYALGILPFHWNINPWPIVGLNALLTSYVLWLVVRSFQLRNSLIKFFGLVVVLSATTGLGWFVSIILPDIFGPFLYLVIYLIVFAWETLSRAERIAIMTIGSWATASHATHLILGFGVSGIAITVLILQRETMAQVLRATGRTAAVICLAAAATIMLHAYLYGEPSLTGKRAPFLLARVIADGPGRWYLEKHCGELRLAVCEHIHDLPQDANDILWGQNGIFVTASMPMQQRLRDEEKTVVLGAVKTYPVEELKFSLMHFWRQLHSDKLSEFTAHPWVLQVFDYVLPNAKLQYLQSRQMRRALPLNAFSLVQDWIVFVSNLIIIGGLLSGKIWNRRLAGLAAIAIFVVIANAAVTGILSNVQGRYGSRVIWLLPFLAALILFALIRRYAESQKSGSSAQSVR